MRLSGQLGLDVVIVTGNPSGWMGSLCRLVEESVPARRDRLVREVEQEGIFLKPLPEILGGVSDNSSFNGELPPRREVRDCRELRYFDPRARLGSPFILHPQGLSVGR